MKTFINYLIVIALLAAAFLMINWDGEPTFQNMAGVILGVACGYYARVMRFGNVG